MSKRMRATGSEMSAKQLARTVRDGRLVSFRFPTSEVIEGYLCGMDDFHWLVVTPAGSKHLIHKGSASIIDLSDHPSYSDEPNRPELERVVAPFREHVEETFFGRQPASDRTA